MTLTGSARHSLKTRITLTTLVIFMISIWSLAFYTSRMLREDMERLVGDQQFSTASLLAAQINEELAERLSALESVAASLTPTMFGNPAALQAFLEQRTTLQALFNGGLTVFDLSGTVIADVPRSAGRIGGNYMDRDYVAATLKEGKSLIGRPVMGKALKMPIVAMTVPIRDAQGKVIGAFGAPINLGLPNFLSTIMEKPYGKTGGYILIAVKPRLVITATDKRRTMEPLAAPGISPPTDRFIQGFEGYAVYVNRQGEEVLNASKHIPIADWNVGVTIPTAEAFSPIRTMQQHMLLAAILLTVLVGGLIWWMLRRQLSPMIDAAKTLATLSGTNQLPRSLPVTSQDEIGDLIGGFNRLLASMAVRDKALMESEARSRAITQSAQDAVVTSDNAGNIVGWNPGAEAMFGYPESEVLGQPMTLLIPKRYQEGHLAGMNQIRSGAEHRVIGKVVELNGLHKDGREFPLELSLAKWESGDGWFITGIIRDITGRKRADEALRESEKRLSAIFQSSPVGIGISSVADGKILDINDAALRLYGYNRDEVVGRTAAELGLYADLRQREEIVRQLRETGRIDRFSMDFRNARGEVGVLELSGRVIYLLGEQCMVLMLSDVTERNRLAAAHLQAQKLASLGTLAGGIAHDFNNILAAIRGNTELAAEDVGPDHVAAESLAEIRKASMRATELVRRIMAFGRPGEARRAVVDVGAVVAEVLQLLRSTLPAGISLIREFAQDTPHVLADAGQLHEAVVNLSTNAAYAIGPRAGSIKYRLEPVDVDEKLVQRISGLKPGRYARLTVTDSGCGMDAATQERIFDAFYTTKPAGQGTGLGLSMVHGTMRSHGGAVTAESAPGKGASFHLYFPVAEEKALKEDQGARSQNLLSTGQRVLYVDDEEALVLLATRMLTRVGHQVSGFADPREALAAFRSRPQDFDVVVTDLSMPQMSGYEFAREVLAVRPDMPVVMTTGYISAEYEQLMREAGIRELILKPVIVDELGRVLDRLFRAGEADRYRSA